MNKNLGGLLGSGIRIGLIALLSSIFYVGVLNHLFENFYFNSEAASYWAKIFGFVGSGYYNLQNLGFLYPPLPFYLLVPFGFMSFLTPGIQPYLVCTLLVILMLVKWYYDLRSHSFSPASSFLLLGMVAVHPTIVWTATSGDIMNALSLLLFYVIGINLLRFVQVRDARSIFDLGILMVLFFFTNPGIVYFTVTFSVLFVVVLLREIPPVHAPGALLALLSPLFFAILSWGYLNWVTRGEFLGFMYSSGSVFIGGWSLADTYPWLRSHGGYFLGPFLVGCGLLVVAVPAQFHNLVRSWSNNKKFVLVALLGSLPVFLLATSTYFFYPRYPVSILYFLLASFMASLVIAGPPKTFRSSMILIILTLAGIPGGAALQTHNASGELTNWNESIRGISEEVPIAEDQRKLGLWLRSRRITDRTMISDSLAYEAISIQSQAEVFLFPFERQYGLALRIPKLLPNQIVVPDPDRPNAEQDPLTRWYPNLYDQGLPEYKLVYDRAGWRVWKK